MPDRVDVGQRRVESTAGASLARGKPEGTEPKRRQPSSVRVERLLKAQADTGATLNRLVMTLLGLGVAGVLALQFPDTYLLATTTTVNVPLAGPTSFKVFLVLLPLFLLGVRAYAEIYLVHWRRLSRLTYRYRMRAVPIIVPFENPLLRIFAACVLYGLIPSVLGALTWKAAVFTGWGAVLLCLTLTSASVLLASAMSRTWPHGVLIATAIVAMGGVAGSQGWFEHLRRPFQLQIANLERASLGGQDLSRADLRRANLRSADLSRAILNDADLSGADMREADLSWVQLRGANLDGAILSKAILRGVDLNGATLFQTTLDEAFLATDHRWLDGTVLRDVSITNARLTPEWPREKFFEMLETWGAVMCNFTETRTVSHSGRCRLYWATNGHFYELIDRVVPWEEAQGLLASRALTGPLRSLHRSGGKSVELIRFPDNACLQGYLWVIDSAEEEQFVLKRFGRHETGGVWIGASDESVPGEWRWIGGPNANKLFWRNGPKGEGGHRVEESFENWRLGEPSASALLEGRRVEERRAGALDGWNDVTAATRLRAVIEYGGVPCSKSGSAEAI